MLTDITIGQYFPGDSAIHRLDPRTKIILTGCLIMALFIFDTTVPYGIASGFILLLLAASRLSWKMLLKSLKPLWWILLFTFVIHICSTPGETFFKAWVFSLTWEGLRQGFFICSRLMLLILLSSLLTFTTSPLALTDAMESLLSPFRKFGLPAHELAMMMTIALRFIPTLIEETDKIMKAQRSRGADFSSGNLLQRMKALIPILVPLFIGAFRRADELAMAMEARCYRGGIGRTRMKELKTGRIDYMAYSLVLLLFGGLLFFKMNGM